MFLSFIKIISMIDGIITYSVTSLLALSCVWWRIWIFLFCPFFITVSFSHGADRLGCMVVVLHLFSSFSCSLLVFFMSPCFKKCGNTLESCASSSSAFAVILRVNWAELAKCPLVSCFVRRWIHWILHHIMKCVQVKTTDSSLKASPNTTLETLFDGRTNVIKMFMTVKKLFWFHQSAPNNSASKYYPISQLQIISECFIRGSGCGGSPTDCASAITLGHSVPDTHCVCLSTRLAFLCVISVFFH